MAFFVVFQRFQASKIVFDEFSSAFEGFYGDAMLVQYRIRTLNALGRESERAYAHVNHAVFYLKHSSVEMSVKDNISLFCILRRKVGIALVTVCEKYGAAVPIH